MKLYQKLHAIQAAIDSFVKDKSGHGYKYTTGSTVLNKIRPLMCEHKLILKQEVTNIENTRIDYTLNSGKNKSEILSKVTMRFTWVDCESGETDVNEFGANGQNDWDKGFGSALTYAERYFLLKFFHVPTDEDDPDAKTPQATTPTPQQKQQQGSEKPWLNKGTEQFNNAKNHIAGGGTIEDIKQHYRLSKEVEGLLK